MSLLLQLLLLLIDDEMTMICNETMIDDEMMTTTTMTMTMMMIPMTSVRPNSDWAKALNKQRKIKELETVTLPADKAEDILVIVTPPITYNTESCGLPKKHIGRRSTLRERGRANHQCDRHSLRNFFKSTLGDIELLTDRTERMSVFFLPPNVYRYPPPKLK